MPDLILALAWVALGSALGGAARFAVSGLVARAVGETFPWGTMTVNVTGSLALGALAAAADAGALAPALWHLAALGFLGSYTTVSSFSLQTLALVRDGETGRAASNVALSLALCLAAAAAGFLAAA
ncbi:MAG TPA: fluoride efflux transporter CrcB [Thermohalobaculum sp.]|nr:fluoride efflux transporter CrcB [Thermohalobaculum sp.]